MKSKILCIAAITISILLAGAVLESRSAGAAKRAQGAATSSDHQAVAVRGVNHSVSVSGLFTGTLAGKIHVDDQEVVITKNTRIYKVGFGLVDVGTRVADTSLYVSGVARKEATVAKLIIISSYDGGSNQDGGEAGELDSREPR